MTRVSQASVQLQAWKRSGTRTWADIAETVGCTPMSLYNWVTGRTSITVIFALRIQRLTGIPVECWTVFLTPPGVPHEV